MPFAQACYVVMQVCEGLDYASTNERDAQGASCNLVHRDISPQNVLVGFEGEIKRDLDFGIAKAAVEASKTRGGRDPEGQVRVHVARAGAKWPAHRPPQRHLLRWASSLYRAADRRNNALFMVVKE